MQFYPIAKSIRMNFQFEFQFSELRALRRVLIRSEKIFKNVSVFNANALNHISIIPFTAKQAEQQSSESENEELKNMERKEKKQIHKVKKLISKKKEQVNKSIAKKMKRKSN